MKTERLYTLTLLIGYLTAVCHFKLVSCECMKAHKSTHFAVPGYVVQPIHTNECRESVSSSIFPVVSINVSRVMMFQRRFSTCCCVVGNASLHQAQLISLDGRPSIYFLYRRIEECVCIPCSDAQRDVSMQFLEPETVRESPLLARRSSSLSTILFA